MGLYHLVHVKASAPRILRAPTHFITQPMFLSDVCSLQRLKALLTVEQSTSLSALIYKW